MHRVLFLSDYAPRHAPDHGSARYHLRQLWALMRTPRATWYRRFRNPARPEARDRFAAVFDLRPNGTGRRLTVCAQCLQEYLTWYDSRTLRLGPLVIGPSGLLTETAQERLSYDRLRDCASARYAAPQSADGVVPDVSRRRMSRHEARSPRYEEQLALLGVDSGAARKTHS